MNNITSEREKQIEEERIEGYNRFINNIDYKQKRVQ